MDTPVNTSGPALPEASVTQAAADFQHEANALASCLQGLSEADWERHTRFKAWTVNDVVLHLYASDYLALLATEGEEIFRPVRSSIVARREAGLSFIEEHRERFPSLRGWALLDAWVSGVHELCGRLCRVNPATRLPWAGPPMGVRMFAIARQMETWSHGQAIYDLLGIQRQESDRLHSIAILGVKTMRWAFVNRGLPPPEHQPWVSLTSPSGSTWEWGTPSDTDFVQGDAADFCRVVTQTRHVLDTQLCYRGSVASEWLGIAQCFAGPPADPPQPGSRCINTKAAN